MDRARSRSAERLLGAVEVRGPAPRAASSRELLALSAAPAARPARPARRSGRSSERSASSGSTFSRRATLTAAKRTSPSSSTTCASGSVSGAVSPASASASFSSRELVVEIGERAGRVRVLEADRRRPPLHLARVEQRREAPSGTSWKMPSRPSSLRLDPLPVLAHAAGRARLDLAEDVRVAPDELLVDRARDLLEVARALLLRAAARGSRPGRAGRRARPAACSASPASAASATS